MWEGDALVSLALVLGGARSGKSSFAEGLAREYGEPVLFVATATAIDEEMRSRISAHRASRPGSWRAIEAALDVGQAVRQGVQGARTVLLDCLTLLVSNCLVGPNHDQLDDEVDVPRVETQVEREVADLLDAARAAGAHLVVVSNEVGMGVVPPYPMGRVYRDLLGRANQRLAAQADAVYLIVAGVPITVK